MPCAIQQWKQELFHLILIIDFTKSFASVLIIDFQLKYIIVVSEVNCKMAYGFVMPILMYLKTVIQLLELGIKSIIETSTLVVNFNI